MTRYGEGGGAIQNEMHAAAGATPNPLTENESVTAVGGNGRMQRAMNSPGHWS